MKTHLILLLLAAGTTLFAQTRPEVVFDTIYNISYPYTKVIQELDNVGSAKLSLLTLTEQDGGNRVKRCRLELGEGNSLNVLTGETNVSVYTKSEIDYLMYRLNEFYKISQSKPPTVYTEHLDAVGSVGNRLYLSLYSPPGTQRWQLMLATQNGFRRVQADFTIPQLINLSKLLKTCSSALSVG